MQTKVKQGFTLVEILIAAGVLSLFLAGAFTIFFGGQKMGSNVYWTQQTVNRLRNACRHISDNIRKSSYPSTIIYTGKVFENNKDDFKLCFTSKTPVFATETADIAGKAAPGTYLLQFPESIPEKQMFEDDTPGTIRYHIYSLTNRGLLLYHLFEENTTTNNPDYAAGLTRSTIPPAGANQIQSSVIIENVESIRIRPQAASPTSPLTISITCKYERGNTRRTEETTAVANIEHTEQNFGTGNW
jgi:prepilin-type N-terminal cleavage/methylation domain-containing protein